MGAEINPDEEVTAEMIEAGAAILGANYFVEEVTLEGTRRELAREVYLAMLSAKRRGSTRQEYVRR